MNDQRIMKVVLTASMLCFALSLTQKCYCTTTSCSDSFMVFILGWAAVFSGGAGLTWLANPLLFASWFFLKRKLEISMFLGSFAFLVTLFFLLFGSVADNVGGTTHQVVSYKPGYWLWVTSSACMWLGTSILKFRKNTRKVKFSMKHKQSDYLH